MGEDPVDLARRVLAAEWRLDPRTPLFTLNELTTHFGEFASFQVEYRDFVVGTGLPPREFRPCPWLYRRLGRLYDIRVTSCPWPRDSFGPAARGWVEVPRTGGFVGRNAGRAIPPPT